MLGDPDGAGDPAPDAGGDALYVSTGHLPSPEQVQQWVDEAYQRYRLVDEGRNADVYPALARVPRDLFGVCAVGTSGKVYAAGDADHAFTIMSAAKPFVFALVCQALGPERDAQSPGRERHRHAVQLAGRDRAQQGRPNESDGELGCDCGDEPCSRR